MRISFALLPLLTLALPAAAQAQRGRDWTRSVVRTPEGGYRMGNPAAPVKLVEYGSITCPHCAEFAAEANAALRTNYIGPGRVSFEYRPYLIFPSDPAVFMLLNCMSPSQFFPVVDQLYASQPSWAGRAIGAWQRLGDQPPPQRMAGLIRGSGLDAVFVGRGMTQARIDACLGDEPALTRLAQVTSGGNRLGVQGTPTFLINGRLVGSLSWAALEPMLRR